MTASPEMTPAPEMTASPDTTILTGEAVAATARTAGLALDAAGAERIAVALAPAFAAFAARAGTLAFDLEPAAFLTAQRSAGEPEAKP